MRRLIEDQGPRFLPQGLQTGTPPCCLGRQEAFEHETIGRQPCRRQRGDHRTGARHRDHRNAGGTRLAHQVIAWIGDKRRPRIGDQGDVFAGLQPLEETPALLAFIVLVTRRQGRIYSEVLQQTHGMAGIFGRNQRHLAQHPQGARTDVIQIANRRSDHE
ncbi:hypothetical protein D3C78_1378480 [compost metagenome]